MLAGNTTSFTDIVVRETKIYCIRRDQPASLIGGCIEEEAPA